MKKMNNKGFSLVELIVVIAIMAVLIGVLAPQFLRYVEKSRLQKDNQAINEIAQASKAAMANETIYTSVGTTTTINGAAGGYTFTPGTLTFQGELANTVGTSVTISSKKYGTAPDIVVSVDSTTNTVTVSTTGYYEDVAQATASTKIF